MNFYDYAIAHLLFIHAMVSKRTGDIIGHCVVVYLYHWKPTLIKNLF